MAKRPASCKDAKPREYSSLEPLDFVTPSPVPTPDLPRPWSQTTCLDRALEVAAVYGISRQELESRAWYLPAPAATLKGTLVPSRRYSNFLATGLASLICLPCKGARKVVAESAWVNSLGQHNLGVVLVIANGSFAGVLSRLTERSKSPVARPLSRCKC